MRKAVWLGLSCVLSFAAAARADVTLPDGQVVPKDSANGEVQIYTMFTTEGEAIDWIKDAHATPDTFSPLCDFAATLMLKQSGSTLGVGWYNVVPGATAAPTLAEIYEVVPPGSAVGTTITGASIRNDPRYLGGAIGIALIRTPPHFSEAKWNTVCTLCTSPGPWILSVTYKSTKTPNTYYLAFEDGNTTALGWSNDGDYNDYVFRFSGLACTGAGEACQVSGAEGACRDGLTECDSSGALVCKQLVQPEAEKCDGVDNDCNSQADDGDGLCPVGKTCVRGSCVPACGDEFPCFGSDVCEDGLCVHPSCVGKTCDAGQACVAGECRAPCDGVKCPGTQVCRVGRCIDPCANVTCMQGYVCDGGACVLDCSCAGCAAGLACAPSGVCLEAGCETQTCGAGTTCAAGACVDACAGAVCPSGERCVAGLCEGGDVGSGTGDDAGAPVPGGQAGAPPSADAAVGAAGSGAGSGTTGGRPDGSDSSGCGCRVVSSSRRSRAAARRSPRSACSPSRGVSTCAALAARAASLDHAH